MVVWAGSMRFFHGRVYSCSPVNLPKMSVHVFVQGLAGVGGQGFAIRFYIHLFKNLYGGFDDGLA
jgi:hypothetical protein